jgi:epoxyqueuosine reductase
MGIEPDTLTSAVKDEARRLGFELVGVTTPEPPPHLQTYEQWLDVGRHASMGYLEDEASRARRADPRLILPECQSILVLGIRYDAPMQPPSGSSPDSTPLRLPPNDIHLGGEKAESRGRVAAYAWGDDYHLVLPPRLHALVSFIEHRVGHPVPNRCYTDTGPLLERDLAQRAGLGWIGKNTCLISPKHGSYFLLAEILLGLPLDPDPPFLSDQCGTCTRCIQACPTDCILPDRTLDAGRCISYLTIENKGEISLDLRHLTGDWLFGCDICQMVCPWNLRFASPNGDPAFAPRPLPPDGGLRQGAPRADLALPVLANEVTLTQEEFSHKFKESPVKRAKRRGYLRNAATALGNRGGEEDLPALTKAAHDADPLVREHATWAIAAIRSRQKD